MRQQVLFVALGSSILLAVALFLVLHAERRRAILEPRLRAIAAPRSNSDEIIVSLRRPRPRRKALPAVLLGRLDAALAATGDRIGVAHLLTAGILAAAI